MCIQEVPEIGVLSRCARSVGSGDEVCSGKVAMERGD